MEQHETTDLEKIIELWLYDLSLNAISQETTNWYKKKITLFIEFAENNEQGITRKTIFDFIGSLHCKQPTAAGYWRAIRAFCRWAAHPDRAYMPDPTIGMRVKFEPAQQIIPPTQVDLLGMLRRIPTKTLPQRRDKAILSFAYFTGCRIGEAARTRKSDIDLRRGFAYLFGKKTNKQRIVPIVDELGKVLADWLGHAPGLYAFPNNTNKGKFVDEPVNITLINHHWHEYQTAQGLARHVNVHMLRHAFATHALTNDVDLLSIKEAMGHSSVAVTAVYAKAMPESMRKKFNRVWA